MEFTIVTDGATLEFSSEGKPLPIRRRWRTASGHFSRQSRPERRVAGRTGVLYRLRLQRPAARSLPSRPVGRRREAGQDDGRIKKQERRKDSMQALKEMEIGVMFWGGKDPVETLRELKGLGVKCGQMGVPGDMPLAGADGWKNALASERLHRRDVFCAYNGESYADIPTVQRTVGFIPKETRKEREARTMEVAISRPRLAFPALRRMSDSSPKISTDRDYVAVRDMVRQGVRSRRQKRADFRARDRTGVRGHVARFLPRCESRKTAELISIPRT